MLSHALRQHDGVVVCEGVMLPISADDPIEEYDNYVTFINERQVAICVSGSTSVVYASQLHADAFGLACLALERGLIRVTSKPSVLIADGFFQTLTVSISDGFSNDECFGLVNGLFYDCRLDDLLSIGFVWEAARSAILSSGRTLKVFKPIE
jgi:hypothetical protein